MGCPYSSRFLFFQPLITSLATFVSMPKAGLRSCTWTWEAVYCQSKWKQFDCTGQHSVLTQIVTIWPFLRHVVIGLSQWGSGFDPRLFYVRFMVN
jgi:hypothetical protein